MDSYTGSSLNFEEGMASVGDGDDTNPEAFRKLRRQPSVPSADDSNPEDLSSVRRHHHSAPLSLNRPWFDDLLNPSAVRKPSGYRRKAYNAEREASHVPSTTKNLFDRYQLGGKQIITFVDWDNKCNIFTGDEQENVILQLSEYSDRIFFWNCCRSDFPEKHLYSKAVTDLKDHRMIHIDNVDCNNLTKNATDVLIVKRITELRKLLPVITHLQIISDDKSFKVLENQMVNIVPCKDMFMSIFYLLEHPSPMYLIDKITKATGWTEVILFLHARPGNLPKSIQTDFQILSRLHGVVILLFCKEKDKRNDTRRKWYDLGQINNFYTFKSSESYKDGSDFNLVWASTELNQSMPVCVPFTLVSEVTRESLFSQVKSNCIERDVTVSSLKQLFDRFNINDIHQTN